MADHDGEEVASRSESISVARRSDLLGGRLLLLGSAVLWSFGGIFIKVLTGRHGVAPQALACLRSAVAGAALAWALPGVPRGCAGRIAAAGLAYAALVGTFVLSTADTTAANAIFLQYSYPLIVAVGAALLYQEVLHRRTLAALGLGMSGVGVILAGSWSHGHSAGLGYGLASAGAFAAFTLIQRGIRRGNAIGLTSAYNLMAALVLLPFALGRMSLSFDALLILAFMAVCQLGIPYVLFIVGLRRVPAAEAALITLLEPVLNPIWTWMGTGEKPGTWTVAGGALIVLALALRFLPRSTRGAGSGTERPDGREP